ncbi:MAG: GTPase, partial [Cyanobacteria bacterium P01_C01_bin.73]
MGIWLVEALVRLHGSLALVSPLLANLTLAVIVLLGLMAAGGLVYYGYLFLRPKRRRSRPKPPKTKVEAAEAALKAIDQQVAQIQDEVARQTLRQASKRLTADYQQGLIKLAVFGSGAVGKTSLVNALVEQVVGEVSAVRGTTKEGETYRLTLPDSAWQIWITDTPGLLEANDRDNQAAIARRIAASADLLLFVIDNDLTQAEFQVLQTLTALGKRAIVV